MPLERRVSSGVGSEWAANKSIIASVLAKRRDEYTREEEAYLNTLPAAVLIERGIPYERVEIIPLASVLTEQSLVDDEHARDLGNSMLGRRGQLSPIVVRARFDESGRIVYDIVDGFHRSNGAKGTGKDDIEANVMYHCSDEEMYDLRILAASSVRSVQFPRLVEWMTRSFQTTLWAQQGMTIAQAFGYAVSRSTFSSSSPDVQADMAELQNWVRAKCQLWGHGIPSVFQLLTLNMRAEPGLMRAIRSVGGGRDRTGVVTKGKLAAIADLFPGERNHRLQVLIMEVVLQRRYNARETEVYAARVRGKIQSSMTEPQIRKLLARIRLDQIPEQEDRFSEEDDSSVQPYQESRSQARVAAQKKPAAAARDYDWEADDAAAEQVDPWDMLEPTDDELEEIEGNKRRSSVQDYSVQAALTPGVLGRGNQNSLSALKARILDLEATLERASRETGSSDRWWQTAVYLSPVERDIMEGLFEKGLDFDHYIRSQRLTAFQAITLIQSAFKKHRLAGSFRHSDNT
ncbi:hypothetical protein A3D08_03840 [Candidatus Roizmanbacteria bacterium RIFCSPHIGHO2_02_FULL_43_11]|uniref:Uncharacterized protein n=1 Tax=Candidatus Roizmanbacteria bacterium RIFCSPHIGHO2_02_FULL_43_11 TaxID=1802043 RepID=A0A1F7HDD8_9BACT|nr:MAG: hypothetical protein A3D08_03840 [Candidatus Roizmanbacteria bacterium RIFCSPHIGHO2_02_FULL_43_11]